LDGALDDDRLDGAIDEERPFVDLSEAEAGMLLSAGCLDCDLLALLLLAIDRDLPRDETGNLAS
jgi:hypothetical protein